MTKRQQNKDELWAEKWLRRQGHADIQPLCDDPPDFVVEGRHAVAVEVTRLTQRMENESGKSKAIADLLESLRCAVQETLIEIRPFEGAKTSWTVHCTYPLSFHKRSKKQQNKITNEVKEQIRSALHPLTVAYDKTVLRQFMRRYLDYDRHADEFEFLGDLHFCLQGGLCFDLIELRHLDDPVEFASMYSNILNESEFVELRNNLTEFHHGPPQFVLQDVSDGEGIALAPELGRSIGYCICDKSKKVRNKGRIGTYDEWWLVLVDHVGIVPMQILGPDEQKLVRGHDLDFWTRVVIVSSRNLDWHYELLEDGTEHGNFTNP